jgi:hypothetical protein
VIRLLRVLEITPRTASLSWLSPALVLRDLGRVGALQVLRPEEERLERAAAIRNARATARHMHVLRTMGLVDAVPGPLGRRSLARRLDVAQEAALAVLCEWLARHEPAAHRAINILEGCSGSHTSHTLALSAAGP